MSRAKQPLKVPIFPKETQQFKSLQKLLKVMTQEKTLQTEKSFAEKFRSLPILEKEKVTNFFNLHNAATWMYLQMSQEAKEYTNEAISASNAAMKSSIDEAVVDMNEE